MNNEDKIKMFSQLGFIMGRADEISQKELTLKHFYMKYLTKNKPVKVVDGCQDWPGISKWKNITYMTTQAKITQGSNFIWRQSINSDDDLQKKLELLDRIQKNGLPGFNFSSDTLPEMEHLWINRNKVLKDDYKVPTILNDTLDLVNIYLSNTHQKDNDDLKSFAKQFKYETWSCVTQGSMEEDVPGSEVYRLLAPYFK